MIVMLVACSGAGAGGGGCGWGVGLLDAKPFGKPGNFNVWPVSDYSYQTDPTGQCKLSTLR